MPRSVLTVLGEVVDERHDRVDHDHQLGARLDGDVEVGRRDHAAVDQLAIADPDRRVDHRQRTRCAHGSRDRHVVGAVDAEHDALARVEVGRREVELAGELAEVVGAPRLAQHVVHVALDPLARVGARGQPLGEAEQHVEQRDRAALGDDLARDAERAPRQQRALARELDQVGTQQVAEVDVFERRLALACDHAHHLLRRDAVGAQRRDERAGRRADVDVELVDARVDREQVERAQRADLIHAAREAPAAEHERRLVAARAAPAVGRGSAPYPAGGRGLLPRPTLLGRNLGLIRRFQLDNVAHPDSILKYT